MITTVNWSYFASPGSNLMRMSTIGTIVPRRFTTPLMKAGALAIPARIPDFHAGAEEYGVDILRVQEIRRYEKPTHRRR
jgi:hypothetical protein